VIHSKKLARELARSASRGRGSLPEYVIYSRSLARDMAI